MVLNKAIVLAAAVALLTACETGPKKVGTTTGGGTVTKKVDKSWRGASRRCGGERVFFDLNQHNLKPAARRTVECWAGWFKANAGAVIRIEGNADERGTREYNLALGDRRANSVKNYLVALGIPARRVKTISYGKERPWVAGSNEASWAKNRNSRAVVPGKGS